MTLSSSSGGSSSATFSMSLYACQLEYIRSMIDRVNGLKVLLLDDETAGIISLVMSHSQILEKEVFLVDRLDSDIREAVIHLKAICFIRPTSMNIVRLCKELKDPLYSEYHLFFTNVVTPSDLETLAKNDVLELVQQIHEFFADIYVFNHNLFSLNIKSVATLTHDPNTWSPYDKNNYNRMLDGLFATLATLRAKPIIRYQRTSTVCAKLARQLSSKLHEYSQIFDLPSSTPTFTIQNQQHFNEETYNQRGLRDTVLLIIDRRDDPITPLLNQWTYQAMLHELIGIENNRVNIKQMPNINQTSKNIVMSPFLDTFYAQNYLSHFGQLGISIKQLLEEYQSQKKNTSKIDSIEDIQRFLETYPDYQKLSGNVSKHVDTVHILNKIITVNNIMDISILEQEIACHNNIQEHFKLLLDKFTTNNTPNFELLRLVLLYALRYEGDSSIDQLKRRMAQKGFDNSQIGLIDALLDYAGASNRTNDLFQNRNLLAIARNTLQRTLQGTSNVLTQHQSLLYNIIESLSKGKLKETMYPILYNSKTPPNASKEKPNNVIVFMVGGTTYEEAKEVCLFSSTNNCNVILGGSTVHNTTSFLADVSLLLQPQTQHNIANQLV